MNRVIIISFISAFMYGQCDEGEVELWQSCYPIETTTIVQNSDDTMGEIPEVICELINLEVLNLSVMFGETNYVTGEIPECIGNLVNLTYLDLSYKIYPF